MKIVYFLIAILLLAGGRYAWIEYIQPAQKVAAKVDQMRAWKWTAETTAVLYHECHSIDLEAAEDDAEREALQKRGIRICDRSRLKMDDLITLCENQIPEAIKEEDIVKENEEYLEDKKQVLKICEMIKEGIKKAEEKAKQEEEDAKEKEPSSPEEDSAAVSE